MLSLFGVSVSPRVRSLRFTPLDRADLAEVTTWMAASSPWREAGWSSGRLLNELLGLRCVGVRQPDRAVVAVAAVVEMVDYAELRAFAVRPDCRRDGVGLHLLASVEQDRLRRVPVLYARVPRGYQPAEQFFAAAGYRPTLGMRGFGPVSDDSVLYARSVETLRTGTRG